MSRQRAAKNVPRANDQASGVRLAIAASACSRMKPAAISGGRKNLGQDL
jgi:hypothetical protein